MDIQYYLLHDIIVCKKEDNKYYYYEDNVWKKDDQNRIIDAIIGIDKRKEKEEFIKYWRPYGKPIVEISKEEALSKMEIIQDWVSNCILHSDYLMITDEIGYYYIIDDYAKIVGIAFDHENRDYRYEIKIEEWNKFLKTQNCDTTIDAHGIFLERFLENNEFEEFYDYCDVNNVHCLQAYMGYGFF